MILNHTKKTIGTGLGVLALTASAFAGETTSGYSGLETMEGQAVEHQLQLRPGFTYISEADFDDSGMGDVSVWRLDIPARYTMKSESGELGLGGLYEFSQYDVGDLDKDYDFNTLAFDAYWKGMFNDNWGYFLYGGITLSADTDESLGDGVTGTGAAGVRYVWSEAVSLGLGLAVSTRLEDDPMFLPVIALNWQIDDRWNLRTLNGATLTFDVSGDKTFLLDLGAKYQRREYRTDKDTSLTERMISAEFGATYMFTPHFGLRGFVGVVAGRNLELRQDDHKLGDEDVDPAPFFGLRALITF